MLWSPKAGCTCAVRMMFDHMGILDEALKKSAWVHDFRPIFYNRYGIPTKKELKNWFVFKIIVNPYKRAVSCYGHCLKQQRLLGDNQNISFHEFLRLVKNQKLDPRDIYHTRPQYIKGEELVINEYIRLENVDHDIDEKINRRFDLQLKMPSESPHHREKKDYEQFLGETLYYDITIFPQSYANFYNDEIKLLVDELYKDDIEMYGYLYANNF